MTKQEYSESRFNILDYEDYLIAENENFIYHWSGEDKPWSDKENKLDYLWNDFKVDVNRECKD